jgi:gluconolactonase
MSMRKRISLVGACVLIGSGAIAEPLAAGKTTRYAPEFDAVIATTERVEKLADGFTWAEGPTWIANGQYLVFTDVPENTMYRWSPQQGLSVFLKPSGYGGPPIAGIREAGANGLMYEGADSVLLADSGTRLIARLDLRTKQKKTLVERFEGKRFNSPNDVIRKRDGTIFFTDPPYGLKEMNTSPLKEQKFNGVYRLDLDGTVRVIDDSLTFPNGIALSPDERTLYVANSDEKQPIWMAYTLSDDGEPTAKRVFADASDLQKQNAPGLPDGLRVASNGYLFATGPGGVIVFTPQGKRLGRIETGAAIANCAFGDDGRTLYMTSHKMLARVRLLIGAQANER